MLLFKPLQRQILLFTLLASLVGLMLGCRPEHVNCEDCDPEAIVFSFADTVWSDIHQSVEYHPLVSDYGPFYPEDVWIEEYPSGDTAAFSRHFCEDYCQYGLYVHLYKEIYGEEDHTFFVHFRDDVDTLFIPKKGSLTLNGVPRESVFLIKSL